MRRGIALLFVVVPLILLGLVGSSRTGLAATPCSYEPRTVTIAMVGEPVTLSLGALGEILVDDVACPRATTESTGLIAVTGTVEPDLVVIDQTGPGGPFRTALTFQLALGFDADDVLRIDGTSGDDSLTGWAFTIDLVPGTDGGTVDLGGVDEIEVNAGDGNDLIDAGLSEADSGSLTTPITIRGGGGDDILTGGSAGDRLYGQGGGDVLDGHEGTDVLNGGTEADSCWYGDEVLSCDPSIELQPSEGAAGIPVLAAGVGWYPENGPIAISFGAQGPPATAPPAPDGSFSAELDVPPAASGTSTATVTACQQCSDPEPVVAETTFDYTAQPSELTLAVTPESAALGETVSVSGSGWYAGEPVSLLVDPADGTLVEPVAAPPADADGLFSESFELRELETGEHRLVACQRCGADDERRRETAFRVEPVQGIPTIQVQPTTAHAGDAVDVVGADWRPDLGRVHLSIGSPTTEGVEVDAFTLERDGSFVASFDLPDLAAGSYTVTACQRCSAPGRIDATDVVSIEAASSLLPWVAGAAAVLLVLVAAYVLLRRAGSPSPKRDQRRRRSPHARVRGRLRPSTPDVIVSREPDGSSDHAVRLVPRPDSGTQRVEEMSHR